MKVAIFSDLHDNLPNLNNFLDWVKKNKIERLIFCGDLANVSTLKYLAENFTDKIYIVGGNADSFYLSDTKKFKNIIYEEDKLEFKLDNQKIIIVHKPTDLKKYLAEDNSFNFAFYGHTHKPWLKQEDGVIVANPGTLKEVFGKSSFATLDTETGKLELQILETK
jgi:phosphoesterase, MJ0936 family